MASFVFNLAVLYELGAALADAWGGAAPRRRRSARPRRGPRRPPARAEACGARHRAAACAPHAHAESSTPAAVREQLAALPGLLRVSLDSVWPVAAAHAAAIAAEPGVELLLGTGPDLATARFAARKRFELTQRAAMVQETEEYAHDQIAMVGPHTPTLRVRPSGRRLGARRRGAGLR